MCPNPSRNGEHAKMDLIVGGTPEIKHLRHPFVLRGPKLAQLEIKWSEKETVGANRNNPVYLSPYVFRGYKKMTI